MPGMAGTGKGTGFQSQGESIRGKGTTYQSGGVPLVALIGGGGGGGACSSSALP